MNHIIQAFGKCYTFSEKGAELISAIEQSNHYEFIWQADPSIWARHAPILFPIVGRLNNNQYLLNGETYKLPQHGFARDAVFEIQELYSDLITFKLENNEQTAIIYPFQFVLLVSYQAIENGLSMTLTIYNKSEEPMPYSIGLHPGFRLPENNLKAFELFSDKAFNWERSELKEGLLNGQKEKHSEVSNSKQLHSETFKKDALVFEDYPNKMIGLKHLHSSFQIQLQTVGFPYLGIWNKYPSQSFICLEPWAGITDQVNFSGDIFSKKGIHVLERQGVQSYQTNILMFAP
jgi:galactose mutarotase-like enzyme